MFGANAALIFPRFCEAHEPNAAAVNVASPPNGGIKTDLNFNYGRPSYFELPGGGYVKVGKMSVESIYASRYDVTKLP